MNAKKLLPFVLILMILGLVAGCAAPVATQAPAASQSSDTGAASAAPVTLTYLVDNYYNGKDEFGVAWDDPTLAVPWGATAPILSGRDQANPRLDAIPDAHMPVWNG